MKKWIMLDLRSTDKTVKVTRALSSEIRLKILRLLIERSSNVSGMAEELGEPLSSIANHVRVLEDAGLIMTSEKPGLRGSQKICGIAFQGVYFNATLPDSTKSDRSYSYTMGIGRYFDCEVDGACGLVSETSYIGTEDSPTVFYSSERVHAQLLWFQTGYVEYRFPIPKDGLKKLEKMSFSMELCSEAPGYNNQWPSDISVHVNGHYAGMIRSKGDYGGKPGNLNPAWWPESRTQYGLLHHVELTSLGSFIDGVKATSLPLADVNHTKPYISLRLGVAADAEYSGGMSLFGERFGNHAQGIRMELSMAPEDIS